LGPIGILCVQRTLARGRLVGFASGLGAATADAAYGCFGSLGWTAIASGLSPLQVGLQIAGGVFLLAIAWQIGRSTPPALTEKTLAGERGSLSWAYGSTFALTMTNPLTVLTFVALFAGASGDRVSGVNVALTVLGVFVGSSAWWLALSGGVSWGRRWLRASSWRWLNGLAAIAIAGYGVRAIGLGLLSLR
ncbi:MAG: LysE family transporter, partial [Cyanobacteria bacterium J06639_1]